MEFTFTIADSEREISKAVDFFSKNPWTYDPVKYRRWVEKAEAELFLGYKTCTLAYYYNQLIGNLISQPHKTIQRFRELKNGRTINEFQRRLVLSFMIRQEEVESQKEGIWL
ncbi:MAG: hypothetical protein ABIB79_04605 [archaeon]